jgi:hypothetical protein
MECFNDELTTKKITVNGDVIFTGALIGNNCLIKNNITISHTGTTDETILYSQLIPAGTFQANDDFMVYLRFFGTNSSNTKTVRLKFNTSVSLIGAIQVAQNQGTTNSFGGSSIHRNIIFKNSLTNQEVLNFASNYLTDFNVNGTALTALTIDFTIDQYFIITGQLAISTETMGIRNVRGQILR